jgi:hypothetical protein
MLAVSPLGGVTIRQRQSSLITDTHWPVMSMKARSRALVTRGAGCCATARDVLTATSSAPMHNAKIPERRRSSVAVVIVPLR